MQYNFYFDICAMCILITLAITSLSRRWVPAYRQRAYFMLFFTTFVSTLSERIETYLQMFPFEGPLYPPLEMLLGSIYFIAHLGSGFCYLMYILSVLDIYVDYRRLSDLISIYLNYGIGIALVFTNLFAPILFYYDENGIYHRGDFIFLYYVLAAYYIGYGISLMFRYKKLMRNRTKLVILSYVIFMVTALIIQYAFPTVLLENFFTTISITLVYISLQNPSEMVDEHLNILNRKAYLEGLDLKTNRNSEHSTIFVTIDNIKALSDEIGFNQAQNVLKRIARYLKNVGVKEMSLQTYAYRYSEYVFAITVHTDDSRKTDQLLVAIAARLQEPWTFGNMAIRVESHCFLLKFPEDYSTTSELMSKVDIICDNASNELKSIIDVKRDIYSTLRSEQDYDMLARNNLDNKTMVVKFQPVLSKIYKINYTSEVFFFCMDENGNEVDMRGHIPDIRVTQSIMDVDEFVYRSACRALSFWNAGDKNGKYRAIVGMSQGEISRTDFVKRIKKILREEKADPTWITLKFTETTITTMNQVAEKNIKFLAEMKCSIIVDKFGSGYGDLDRILSLPVVQVNIDRSILIQARESEQMKKVAQGIVNLFHDISIFVGAPDISSESEKRMAEELGCDYLSGDFMGRPMKDSSFVKYIDAYFDEGKKWG